MRGDNAVQVSLVHYPDLPAFLIAPRALQCSYPLTLTVTKVSQGLLAGNTLIIKAPPTTPCVVSKFVELAQSVFPPGVLQVLCGGNDL